MRVLITNDDGIDAPGIQALATATAEAGHDVVVAAPQSDQSGMGAALGRLHLDQSIDVRRTRLGDIPAYGVLGPPALAVLSGMFGAFGPAPDLVLSGVNAGLNLGQAILHSGTVGAALTAATMGSRAVAVSIDGGGAWRFDVAAGLAVSWLDWLCRSAAGTLLNLNVPALAADWPADRLPDTRWASLAPFGAVQVAVAEATGGLQAELREGDELPPGTDAALVAEGVATVTALAGLREASPAQLDHDLTELPNVAPPAVAAHVTHGTHLVPPPAPDAGVRHAAPPERRRLHRG